MITFYRELGSRPDFRVREIRRVCAELEEVPVAPSGALRAERTGPLGFLSPVLDGQRTNYYEWHGAGHHRLGAGGSAMHRDQHLGRDLWFGFDLERLYVRRTSRTVCCGP